MAFAERTRTEVASTRAEIEKILRKAKAERIVTMDEAEGGTVMFLLSGRIVRFVIPLRSEDSAQTRRSRWRALLLVIKAKLESIEAKIETSEEAFLAHVVMPNGQSFAQWTAPVLKAAIADGRMPTSPLMIEGPKL